MPRFFADPHPSPDETSFQVDNTSDAYYTTPWYLLHRNSLQPVPPPRVNPSIMDLASVIDVGPIEAAKRISFHAAGDTGAAKGRTPGAVKRSIANEASVADSMVADLASPDPESFAYILGDVVYNFGEAQYYYDQFYEPFRGYDRPIFAIPGNHDGMPESASAVSLEAFLANFCTTTPGVSPNSGGLVRSTMDQPGVYFTLDAPFVSIIGLYTNILEGPGVISSQGGQYPSVTDDQLAFLTSELARLKPARDAKERAVIIACHHPPVSVDALHGGATGLHADLDKAFAMAGLMPDAVLSGHAHLYQRFERLHGGKQIPYVVAGSGGYNASAPMSKFPKSAGEYSLAAGPVVEFGYLTVDINMNAAPTLTITFRSTSGKHTHDSVTVTL